MYQILVKRWFNTSKTGSLERLLTEHIELNSYLGKKNAECTLTGQVSKSEKYEHCNAIETVQHYLLKCNKYMKQRKYMFTKLMKINHKFKNGNLRKWNVHYSQTNQTVTPELNK